jgi:hypothetical protein
VIVESKVIWSGNGWERRDYATITSGRVVRYNKQFGQLIQSEVSASRDGVRVSIVELKSADDRDWFLGILRRAWRQHLHLRQEHGNNPLKE